MQSGNIRILQNPLSLIVVRTIQSLAFTILLALSSLQCRDELRELAKVSDLRITPLPVIVNNNFGYFEMLVKFPPNKILPKSDSVIFEVSTIIDQEKFIIGRSLMPTASLNKDDTMSHFAEFDFEIKMTEDSIPLIFSQEVYLNGLIAPTDKPTVGLIVKNKR